MSKLKKLIWIPIALVVAIAIVVLVLSLVRVNPVKDTFDGYSKIDLVLPSSDGKHINKDGVDITDKVLSEGLNSSDFSIMQAVLEGQFSYDIKVKTHPVKDGDNEYDENEVLDAAAILAYGAGEGEYVLRLHYSETRELKVGDITVKYDRVLIRIKDSQGEIREMDCVPYLDYNLNNGSFDTEYNDKGEIGSAYYKTNVFTVKMKTSGFMNAIAGYVEENNL